MNCARVGRTRLAASLMPEARTALCKASIRAWPIARQACRVRRPV